VRIVAVAHYGLPQNRGGSELMLHELLAALTRAGHYAELIVTEQDGPTVQLDGVLVHQGAEHLDRLRTQAYDVGIGHHKETGRILDWAHRNRRPAVQVVHNTNRLTTRFLARRTALVVYNTQWLHRKLGRRARALVVHPPVWGDDHRTQRGDAITLVNPIPAKGAATFYALAERMPDLPFLAVEGGYQRDEQIRRADLPNVTWQPHTADMCRDVWARTRVLLMPSDYESWGMVGIEAMHSGIPVIAHPTPGLRESLAGAGTFLDRDDVDAWEQAIRRLYDDEAAAQRARQRAAELDPRPELDAFVRAVEALA
jgi:glycosyltransferase involved in cell wall biosynthesis